MTIIGKIKETVEAATGLCFFYDTPQTLNLRLDNAPFPCALMHIVESGAFADDNGVIRERLTVEVLFASKSRLDFDGLQVEESELDAMRNAAFEWLLYLRMHAHKKGLRFVSNNSTNRYYSTYDAIFSAYGVNVTLEDMDGVSKCALLPPPTPEPVETKKTHNFDNGIFDRYFYIEGNLSTQYGSRIVDDIEILQCLKIESNTRISFTTEAACKVKIYTNQSNGATVKINDVAYTIANEYLEVNMPAGVTVIKKGTKNSYIFYIEVSWVS